jgi:hypothetical protein
MHSLYNAKVMLEKASSNTWRQIYKVYEDAEMRHNAGVDLATLSDEELALCRFTAEQTYLGPMDIKANLPSEVNFDVFAKMCTAKGEFFKGFLLVTRKPIDGILIGFGNDDMYYVLVTWDWDGPYCWMPKRSLYGELVLA